MTERPFGFGVIGVGMAAKPHALALKALSDSVRVVGVYARSTDRRAAFAETYGFPEAKSAGALGGHPDVDALLLITPPDARWPLIDLFTTNGKHILCEKPLERTVAAADKIATHCRARHVSLGIVFQHRFRAASRKLMALCRDGALGRLDMVRAEVPWWRDQDYYDEPGRGTLARDGGGVLISQAIHTLDLMLAITGPVTVVQALAATTRLHRMETEDFVAAGMTFANGAVGSLMATTAAFPGKAESLEFEFSHANARLQSGVLTLTWRDGRIERFGETATTGGGSDPMAFPFDWHQALIASFVSAVRAGREPEVNGNDGVRVQVLIDALLTSSREGRRIELP